MPLSAPAPRKLEHLRDIQLRGYVRDDGLVDIEAHLTDTKTYGFPSEHRGQVGPGDPIHGMWVRMTINEDMLIIACEAASDHTPFAVCTGAVPAFANLAGLSIGPGFNRAVNERVGGVLGCTHLREVLAQMGTVAFQTMWPLRNRRQAAQRKAESAGAPRRRPALLGTCHAYAPSSPVVRKKWPEWSDLAEKVEETPIWSAQAKPSTSRLRPASRTYSRQAEKLSTRVRPRPPAPSAVIWPTAQSEPAVPVTLIVADN